MVGIGGGIEGGGGDGTGVERIAVDSGDDLGADTFDGVGVEARLGEGEAEKVERLVAVFGENAGGDGDRIVARAEAEIGGERLARGLEGLGVHVARAFLDQAHHQVGRAAFGGIVEIGTAADADFQREEGNLG